jgi:DHA2 family multidrug resistance protein
LNLGIKLENVTLQMLLPCAWVLTSYIVAAAIMTPPTGFLAGRFGLKRLFLVSVAGFTFSLVLCGFSQSLVQIVLFRIMQGLFGAALVPLSQTVLMNISPKERQGSVIALWGVAVMAGPVLRNVMTAHTAILRSQCHRCGSGSA